MRLSSEAPAILRSAVCLPPTSMPNRSPRVGWRTSRSASICSHRLRDEADATTNWERTSDSIALELARRLNAERLVVVKSCHVGQRSTIAELGAAGVLDAGFAGLAAGAAFPIDVIHHSELTRMRALLLGEIQSFAR